MSARVVPAGLVALALVVAAATACSSSSSATRPSPSSSPVPSSLANTAAASTTSSAAGAVAATSSGSISPRSGGEPLASVGCGAIPTAQADLLLAEPISSVDITDPKIGEYPDHHFTCDAGMDIAIYPDDSAKTQYNTDVAAENVAPSPLPGIADLAVFTQSGLMVAGAGPMPDVYVHKGNATCEITTSGTITEYKIHDNSTGLSDGVTVGAAKAWSAKAAGLCGDVFTAIKA